MAPDVAQPAQKRTDDRLPHLQVRRHMTLSTHMEFLVMLLSHHLSHIIILYKPHSWSFFFFLTQVGFSFLKQIKNLKYIPFEILLCLTCPTARGFEGTSGS